MSYDNPRLIIFSSFQHVDMFKLTLHLTRTYNAENSNISNRMRTQGNSSKHDFFFNFQNLR